MSSDSPSGTEGDDKKQGIEGGAGKPLYISDAEKWLEMTAHGPDLLCLVLFRGSWCKYDRYYLRKLGQYHMSTMKDEKVTLIAWTSEGSKGAKKADEEWGLTKDYGYDFVIGDDTVALAKWLREDEVLPDLRIVSPDEDEFKAVLHAPDVASARVSSYPNGLVMPGMVWYAHHGNLVFQWAASCDAQNGYGGPGRPDPTYVWGEVSKRKHALDHGNAIMPVHGPDVQLCARDMEVSMSNCSIM